MDDSTSCISLVLPTVAYGNMPNATIKVYLLSNGNAIVGDMFFQDYGYDTRRRIIDDLNAAHGCVCDASRWFPIYQGVIEALLAIHLKDS